jgi:hypothetical protein
MAVLRSLEGTETCQNSDGNDDNDDDVRNAYCIMFSNQTYLNTVLD